MIIIDSFLHSCSLNTFSLFLNTFHMHVSTLEFHYVSQSPELVFSTFYGISLKEHENSQTMLLIEFSLGEYIAGKWRQKLYPLKKKKMPIHLVFKPFFNHSVMKADIFSYISIWILCIIFLRKKKINAYKKIKWNTFANGHILMIKRLSISLEKIVCLNWSCMTSTLAVILTAEHWLYNLIE